MWKLYEPNQFQAWRIKVRRVKGSRCECTSFLRDSHLNCWSNLFKVRLKYTVQSIGFVSSEGNKRQFQPLRKVQLKPYAYIRPIWAAWGALHLSPWILQKQQINFTCCLHLECFITKEQPTNRSNLIERIQRNKNWWVGEWVFKRFIAT